MNGMLLAEIRRWSRSSAWTVPLLGLAFGVVQFMIVLAVSSAKGWDGLLAGNVMWATGLAMPAAALLLALVHVRERRARGGGAWWRPGSPIAAGVCRILVAMVVVGLTNFLVLAPAMIVGLANDPETFPAARVLALAGALTLSSCALYPALDLLAARWGSAAVLVPAVIWMVLGVLTAEHPQWTLIPPAWPIRALLPLLGTHANGVFLAPDHPIATESPVTALLLTAATFALLVAGYLFTGNAFLRPRIRVKPVKRLGRDAQTDQVQLTTTSFAPLPGGPVKRGRAAFLLGQPGSLRRTPLTWLIVAALVAQLGVTLLWQSPAYAEGFAELALLPVGATLLGVIGWSSTREAWRAVVISPRRIGDIALARLLTLWVFLMGTIVTANALTLMVGADPGRALRAVLLSASVGWMLLVATFWLTARFSPGVAAAVSGSGLIASLVLGTGEVASTLWPYALWAWAHTPATEGWAATVVVTTVSALTGCVLCLPAVSALRRRAAET